MNTNDNTYLTINRLIDTLIKDLKDPAHANEEYRARLIATINDLNKLRVYY